MAKQTPVLVKKHGKRNRAAGHALEGKVIRAVVQRGIHPKAVSSRAANRSRDGKGIDLVNEDESLDGRMVDNIQCKSSSQQVNYINLLSRIDDDPGRLPVVIHEHTRPSQTGVFMIQNHYAICYAVDYLELLAYREGFRILEKYTECLVEEDLERLRTLGLLSNI